MNLLTIYLLNRGHLSQHRCRYLSQVSWTTGPATRETTLTLKGFEGESLLLAVNSMDGTNECLGRSYEI